MKTLANINRQRAAGFVLLEVIVSMVILGIAMATMMRSFTISIGAIRNNDVTTQATVLAESALQNLEAEPPSKGEIEGSFELEGYPQFSYTVETDEEKIKYRLKTQTKVDNLRDIKVSRMQIHYNDPRGKVTRPVEAYLVVPQLERFSYESKLRNELFSEAEGI